MMTPRFKIEQTENTIIITILAPYTKLKNTEIHVLEDDVRFYSAPYYLRLNLPGHVEEGANSSAKYHVEAHSFVIILDKSTPGETFANLDMLTAMLQPKVDSPSTSSPFIEIMSSTGGSAVEPVMIDSNDWFIHQKVEEELPTEELLQKYKYGFASRHSGLGNKYETELAEVTEIKDPDSLSPIQRQVLQEETENDKFSDDHYFQDLMLTDLTEMLEYQLNLSTFQELDDTERDQLKNLANQEFLLGKTEHLQLYLGVVDILFAYLYDRRINLGKSCVESQWNVSRLSSTLSFFHVFNHLDETVRACVRKSLTYPLYRHWDLSLQTLIDTHTIVSAGNLAILKCFLRVNKLFKSRDPYYLLNQLYIDEYTVWIQQASAENWKSLAEALDTSIGNLKKEDVGFDLLYLDIAAKVTMDEAVEEEMSEQISGMEINIEDNMANN